MANRLPVSSDTAPGRMMIRAPAKPTSNAEIRRKRLKFRCRHRGTKELDLVFGEFADRHIATLAAKQLDRFEALLAIPDPDIYSWVSDVTSIPKEHDHDVMRLLKDIKITIK